MEQRERVIQAIEEYKNGKAETFTVLFEESKRYESVLKAVEEDNGKNEKHMKLAESVVESERVDLPDSVIEAEREADAEYPQNTKKILGKLIAVLIGLVLTAILVVVGVKMGGSRDGEGQFGSEWGNSSLTDETEAQTAQQNSGNTGTNTETYTDTNTEKTLDQVIEMLSKADWKAAAAKESSISLTDAEYETLMQLKYAADECISCMGEEELTEDFAFVIKEYLGAGSNNFKNIRLLNYAAAAYRFEMAEQEISLVTIDELGEYWEALCEQELGNNREIKAEFESLSYYDITYSGVEYVDGMVNLYVRRNDSYENGQITLNETSKIERKQPYYENGKLLNRDTGKVTCTIETVTEIDQYIVVYGWSDYYNIPYAMCLRNGNDLIGRRLECIYYFAEQAATYDVIK